MKKDRNILSFVSVASVLILWQIFSIYGGPRSILFSSPLKIVAAGYALVKSGAIFPHLWFSLSVYIVGLLIAIITGFLIAVGMDYSRYADRAFRPFVYLLGFLPMVALIPVLIVWFGFGFLSKAVIVFVMCVVPILLSTKEAFRNVDRDLVLMATSFGATQGFIARTVKIPSVLPAVFAGIRIAVGRGLVGVVVGDLFGRSIGLGYLIYYFGNLFDISGMMFTILILAGINILVLELVSWVEGSVIKLKK
jgi:ABC-type nitrate/sulfonate/bicarbonate transport system permease component